MQKQALNKSPSAAGAQASPASPLWRLLRPTDIPNARPVDPVKLRSFSFNTGAETDIGEERFEAELMANTRKIVAEGGGTWTAPAGECRAEITCCAGSALISLDQASCKKAVGFSVVTWSDDLDALVWRKLLRAYLDSTRPREPRPFEFAGRVSPSRCLPRMGTLIWPAIATCLDGEGLFLAEATFWSLGLALLTEKRAAQR